MNRFKQHSWNHLSNRFVKHSDYKEKEKKTLKRKGGQEGNWGTLVEESGQRVKGLVLIHWTPETQSQITLLIGKSL